MIEVLANHLPGSEEWLVVLVPLFLIAYFIPFFVAVGRKHRFITAIGLINLLLGWTLIGWLAAMIWAVNRDVREHGEEHALSGPMYFVNEPRLNERGVEHAPTDFGHSRICRFCAESIKAAALVCRYCGRDVVAAATVEPQGGRIDPASIEKNFEELQALLRDREEDAEQRLADVEPATNYVAPQEETAGDGVSAEVAQQLSGWKKFG